MAQRDDPILLIEDFSAETAQALYRDENRYSTQMETKRRQSNHTNISWKKR